jgi:hypothetical protein
VRDHDVAARQGQGDAQLIMVPGLVVPVWHLDDHAAALDAGVASGQRLGALTNSRFRRQPPAHISEHHVHWQHPLLLDNRRRGGRTACPDLRRGGPGAASW